MKPLPPPSPAARPPEPPKARAVRGPAPADPSARLVALAEITRPHGVQGELRLKLYNRDSDLLLTVKDVVIEYPDGERAIVRVTGARRANDAILMRLEGCASRNDADELRSAQVLVPRELFPPAEEGEYYADDLIGLRVIEPEGELGPVREFISYPTCDVLRVETAKGDVEVYLLEGVVESIDLKAGEIRVASRIEREGE